MRQRLIYSQVMRRLERSPAVGIVGPRQCGKTTLSRSFGGRYYDLEQESERLRLDIEWPGMVESGGLIVLDEAQSWPELFPRIRGAIDADRKRNGRFLLLGSVSPALMTHVAQSLAGRLSLIELTPFLFQEIAKSELDRLWLCGGYPDGGVLGSGAFPRWQSDYLQLLSQRDLPNWGLPARPQVIFRMIKMLAAVHAQNWNASQLGQSLGLDYKTVNSYLDFLEGAFLVRRLQPFHGNIGKRLVKSAKVYWRDSGLLHALMRVEDEGGLFEQPWVGASWEGFVIEQILSHLHSSGRSIDATYFRTSDQHEIDLVLDLGRQRIAVEIKLTTSPAPEALARLNKSADMIGAKRRILVSRTPQTVRLGNVLSCSLPEAIEDLMA
jgi:predicted AAA+ superfamily ATPase